jgi:hypothetical protein
MGKLGHWAPAALAVLAVGAVALLFTNAPVQAQSELAALRLPELQKPILPDPGYQTGFPEVSACLRFAPC